MAKHFIVTVQLQHLAISSPVSKVLRRMFLLLILTVLMSARLGHTITVTSSMWHLRRFYEIL